MKKILLGLILSVLLISSFSPTITYAEEHPGALSIRNVHNN